MTNLSKAAKAALINLGSSKLGTQTSFRGIAPGVMQEFCDAGIIGNRLGLTRKGSITRDKLVNAALDAAF